MDPQEASSVAGWSAAGVTQEFDVNLQGEIEFIGLATTFKASFSLPLWKITKITWATISGKRCIIRKEDNVTNNKYDDRANNAIMGWRV